VTTGATSSWAYAYGHLDVTVVVVATPLAELGAQLKAGQRPAAQTMTPAGTHPQVLLFGQHSHVRNWFQSPARGGRYDEWIIATPFLEWTDSRGATSAWATMSRLYLDSAWFTLLGWLYAYPKKVARMTATTQPGRYQVLTFPGSQPRVEMEWEPAGAAMPWPGFPNSEALASLFGQPFLERFFALPWLGSRMWFELATSTVQGARVRARIHDGCARGFSPQSIDCGSIVEGIPGAFRLSCDWMLSRPYLAPRLPAGLRTPMPPDCRDQL
jgi:hypothetical protein